MRLRRQFTGINGWRQAASRGSLPNAALHPFVADLAIDAGVRTGAATCREEELLVPGNDAGFARHIPFARLPAKPSASRW